MEVPVEVDTIQILCVPVGATDKQVVAWAKELELSWTDELRILLKVPAE